MSPNHKAQTPALPAATERVVITHARVQIARSKLDDAKAARREAIDDALAAGATLRSLGQRLGVSAQAIQAMTK